MTEIPGDRLGQGSPGTPATGRGPGRGGDFSRRDDDHPSAGWGATRSVGRVIAAAREPLAAPHAILKMNQLKLAPGKDGFDCPGCAWPDDRNGLHLDVCENGIKHVTWEMTRKKVDGAFFAQHTVTELNGWNDFDLENQGRLTEPLSYDPETDRYVPISWDDAYALVGDALRGLDGPDEAAFYTSGRLSNEATFLYQLWVREFGTNNMPDCSNMCHEASGRALIAAIGTGKGTCDLDDWESADLLILMAVNAASNAPRMLTSLAAAARRGAEIVHVNPLIEAASKRTIVPHDFASMATMRATKTGTMNVQPRIGGDLALLRGLAKVVLEQNAVDQEFIEAHTDAYDAYRKLVDDTEWDDIVHQSGVAEEIIRDLAGRYIASRRTIIAWCLGLTQQEHSVDTMREIVNLLLLRGNIGRLGAGPSPIRGHSNVQGNRTCGVNHHPTEEWLAKHDAATGIVSPRAHGLGTVATIEAMAAGTVKVFVSLGGNFALAAPDTAATFAALRNTDLTVQVSTKLNRSHLVHGRRALILPCLGRTEKDVRATGEQGVTVEDSMSYVHLSYGKRKPASPLLRSESAILCGMARATLPASATPWELYAEDYDRIRDVMARALTGFEDFNRRAREPFGFRLAQPARERVWLTASGKAEFNPAPMPDVVPPAGRLMLSTVRSHDQWNTTIYSDNDRYRGIKNLRTLLFMNREDMAERGLGEFDLIDITSHARDGSTRTVWGYRAVGYDTPRGSVTGYMPELNVLCALTDNSPQSDQPLTKHLIVEVTASAPAP
ncbi:FdhF/YdeP family oxidoreductase [Amorphoplanes digitatis]|uniref:Molybdopterin-dependent oxidoreductase alpha subunit n=1 Tax=Actinoplanes digitatis TaxID=1868 RepID=A0A7W7HWN8_9ACTN|nr:FdhF/YdeP family oxidoreductase [Actinoplanes digitatis]MBB4762120.1 molybdopterin-dependent oxidoreductase alpha subunit [Actinoplanes digitatis]GID96218.1 formate dehydrogenase subunit alpha [Actinoplanes digitatis]